MRTGIPAFVIALIGAQTICALIFFLDVVWDVAGSGGFNWHL